jgi:hypothetical protein
MSSSHAAPVPTTITDDEVLTESKAFMVGRREEAQRIYRRELEAGMPPKTALLKAAPLIRAASRALVKHRAELIYRTA